MKNSKLKTEYLKKYKSEFPQELEQILNEYEGFSGLIGESYISIFTSNDLLKLNDEYEVEENIKEFCIFASNGGGKAFGFFYTNPFRIMEIPFIGMRETDCIEICSNKNEFFEKLEKGEV